MASTASTRTAEWRHPRRYAGTASKLFLVLASSSCTRTAHGAQPVPVPDKLVQSCILTHGELMKKRLRNGTPPKLQVSMINDGFCDCVNGVDEPGTSACAGHALPEDGGGEMKPNLFFCENTGAKPKWIYSSQVGDGVCDCCDSSDETATSCPSTCAEEGALYRQQKAAQEQEIKEAVAITEKHEAESRQKEGEWRNELANKPVELEKLKAERDRLQQEYAAADKAWMDEQMARTGTSSSTPAPADTATTTPWPGGEGAPAGTGAETKKPEDGAGAEQESGAAAKDSISEYAKWMDKDAAEHKQLADEHPKHDDEDHDDDSPEPAHDETPQPTRLLNPEPAAEPQSTEAKSELHEARDAAREAQQAAQRALDEFEKKHSQIERNLGVLRKYRQYYSLLDRCLEMRAVSYRYSVCFFDRDATQDHTRLGKFERFEDEGRKLVFEGGDWCPGGPARSLQVLVECGKEERILSVDEPERCGYRARMTHPSMCKRSTSDGGVDAADTPRNYEL